MNYATCIHFNKLITILYSLGKPVVSPEELTKMVADCMREDYSDELSDEDDPDLLVCNVMKSNSIIVWMRQEGIIYLGDWY